MSIAYTSQNFIARQITTPEDSVETRLKKILLVTSSMAMAIFAAIWGLLYIYFNAYLTGAIPLSYSALSFASFGFFLLTHRYSFYRVSQLTLTLILPFCVMASLGSFRASSVVVVWAVISPFGALFFSKRREAYLYFISFAVLVAISAGVELAGLSIVDLAPGIITISTLPAEIVTLFYAMNIIALMSLVFYLLAFFVRQREKAYDLVRIEQDKAEGLLLNILPEEIAAILKNEKRTIADYFDEVSILFADVVGFTPLSQRLKPRELVELLNKVFSYFDELSEKYGVEKIKTIGDCYMAASGLPRPRTDHAQVLTRMALEAREYIKGHDFNGHRLVLRMGINSGPVVAGVIGKKKFTYDLWGDAVNTASRMESHGSSGDIQITESVYNLIQDSFYCEALKEVSVKGKGLMPIWHVHAEKLVQNL